MTPIQIRRPEVVEHIRQLAELTGLSITDAIEKAVDAQLALERKATEERIATRRARSEQIVAELRQLPVVGPRLTDDDLYDEEGMPK